jgi:putative glutamine amidotransferase
VPRLLVSFAKPEKAAKYKTSLSEVGGPDLAIGEAWSTAPPPPDGWGALASSADGLLLTGGSDIDPSRYGEATHPEAGVEVVAARDEMEWQLLAAARARRVPVFAICRGHQVVNAFLGGKLWQDLGEASAEAGSAHDHRTGERRRLVHPVAPGPAPGSLRDLLAAAGPLQVNSLHHQAVKTPGRGLAVAAMGPAGVIEATEMVDPDWWVWSVQWHPEELLEPGDHPLNRRLFERFLEAAAARARRRGSAEVLSR